MQNIRNFSIIAHIDHGKSTLSERIVQICSGFAYREKETQALNSTVILERERGITIKAKSVFLYYKALNGEIYQLNLIDTPGHVDFFYEVSRSLAASEGVLLVVDASQGVEAQTLSNCFSAIEMGLEVIPIINKIDLQTAYPDLVIKEIEDIIGISASDAIRCSAKIGTGIVDVLERLVRDIPPPKGNPIAPLQALIIDSWFDNYLGVISLVRIKNGTLREGDKIKIMSTGQSYTVSRLGVFTPKQKICTELKCGTVGWMACNIKDIFGARVGDTLTGVYNPANEALQGFQKINPMVYAGLFPIRSEDYRSFHYALKKLSLNDASLSYEIENSIALGFGFRCGFLGLLHMEIIKERLEREYCLNLIITAPTVVYEVEMKNKQIIYIDNPLKLPSTNDINELREPIVECRILSPKEYVGNVMKLCIEKRGVQTTMVYHGRQVALTYEIPMSEVVLDFFNLLKSASRGYASLDYSFKRFQSSNMVRLDILINGENIDALAFIIHKKDILSYGFKIVKKIKKLIPRQQFNIEIQAAVGNRIIASSTIKQFRKNVTAKCHGGDVSRKKKLLKKQQEGKKHMKKIGKINLPQEVFFSILHFRMIDNE